MFIDSNVSGGNNSYWIERDSYRHLAVLYAAQLSMT